MCILLVGYSQQDSDDKDEKKYLSILALIFSLDLMHSGPGKVHGNTNKLTVFKMQYMQNELKMPPTTW